MSTLFKNMSASVATNEVVCRVSQLENTIGITSQPLDVLPLTPHLEIIRRDSKLSSNSKDLKNRSQYKNDEVHKWLEQIGRMEHIGLFDKFLIINLKQAATLDEKDLRHMGIIFNVKYMLEEIEKLKALTNMDRRSKIEERCSVVQEEEEENQHDFKMSSRFINEPGKWDAMISYTQQDGKAEGMAQNLFHTLEKKGWRIWMDTKMNKCNTAAMEEAVKNSRAVIAIFSCPSDDPKDSLAYANRNFCLKELRWALQYGTCIQPVVQNLDKGRIGFFINQLPQDLKKLGDIDFIHLDKSRPKRWEVSVEEVMELIDEETQSATQSSATQGINGERKESTEGLMKVRERNDISCGKCIVQ
jgi:hypothetical protein